MISGGLIAGGEGPGSAPPTPGMSVAPDVVTVPTATAPDTFYKDATMHGVLNHQKQMQEARFGHEARNDNWNFGLGIVDRLSQLVGGWVSWAVQTRWMEAQENINDRRADAAENIAQTQTSAQREFYKYADAADDRRNGPNGMNARVEQIRGQTAIQINKDDEAAKTERAALTMVDRSFDGRPDYGYGFPFDRG